MSGRVRQLDGLRALAVLAVMYQHTGLASGNGGVFGVDAFFVLSGFLITGVLLGERDARGSIGLGRFYLRRLLRLYPALLAMVLLTTPFGGTLSADDTWRSWATAAAGALTYTSNIVTLAAHKLTMGSLDPTWSLAVEEQFYLLWPLMLIGALRSGWPVRRLAAVALVVSVALQSMFWLGYHGDKGGPPTGLHGTDVYFRPDSRFGELLLGCALAMFLARTELRPGELLDRLLSVGALAGIGLLVLARAVYLHAVQHGGNPMRGIPIAAFGAALLVARLATSDTAWVSRLLRVPPLPQIGLISYGLYLWHAPMFELILKDPFGIKHGEQPVQWGLAFVAATLSLIVVERPFLRLKDRLRQTPNAALEDVEAEPIAAPRGLVVAGS